MKKMFFILMLASSSALAERSMTMNEYLDQVRSTYRGYQGSKENREAAKDKSVQADLITSFRLEGNYQNTADKKLSANPVMIDVFFLSMVFAS